MRIAPTASRPRMGPGLIGLPVLAEGVETSEELKFLAAEACDEAQGYHLGMPAKIEDSAIFTHPESNTYDSRSVIYLSREKLRTANV